MRNLIILLYLLLCTSIFAESQSLWRKGTVKTNEGQQLEGLIKDEEWIQNPGQIEFKQEGGEARTFTVEQVAEFSTDRPVKYRSYLVEFDADDQSLTNLPGAKESVNITKEKVFLKVLVDSRISLMFLLDKRGRRHFFMENDGTVTELLNRLYGMKYDVKQNARFRQQIILITNDCQEVQKRAANLDYKEADLETAFKKINACKGSSLNPLSTFKVEKRKPAFGIAAHGALANSEFSFASLSQKFVFPSAVCFGGGAFLELYSKKRPNRFSFYNELMFRSINQEGTSSLAIAGDYTLTAKHFKLITAIRTSYPGKSGGRFYWNIGFVPGMRTATEIRAKNGFLIEDPTGQKKYKSELEIGGILGVGKTFNLNMTKINLELRYELSQAPSTTSPLAGSKAIGLHLQIHLKN